MRTRVSLAFIASLASLAVADSAPKPAVIVAGQRGIGPLALGRKLDLPAVRAAFAPRTVSPKPHDWYEIGATIEFGLDAAGEVAHVESRDPAVQTARGSGIGTPWDRIEAVEGPLFCKGGPQEHDTFALCWNERLGFAFEVASSRYGGGVHIAPKDRDAVFRGRKVTMVVWSKQPVTAR